MTTLTPMNPPTNSIIEKDRKNLWHPYSSINQNSPLFAIKAAKGVTLTLEDGTDLVDGMSSWWSAIHGYNHPKLNEAAHQQIDQFSHVMFGGLTHEPAAELGEKLVALSPQGLEHVFLCDSGSVSVEVAMKLATQYWIAKKQEKKSRFLTIRNGYHGDTFAAMSVTDPVNGMHHLFKEVLTPQLFSPAPTSRFDGEFNQTDIDHFEKILAENVENIAAVILEPIVQGAGGMRIYHPQFLSEVAKLCKHHQVLLIADEIATGFGRTGKMFACEFSQVSPDILCVGKALTGGYLSLAAAICTHDIAHTICNNEPGVFMHGPTFMGNPLACAIANASIDELLQSPWEKRIREIQNHLEANLKPLNALSSVKDIRCLGAIGVLELKEQPDFNKLQTRLVELGVWLRPFGKLIYTMPPYIADKEALSKITDAITLVAQEFSKN